MKLRLTQPQVVLELRLSLAIPKIVAYLSLLRNAGTAFGSSTQMVVATIV